MLRHAPLNLATLTDAQRGVVDEVRAGRRGTVPANVVAWLPSPELARRAAALGEFVRYETSLGPRLSELAILVVARHWSCAYEWAVHAGEAAAAGVPPAVIEAVARDMVPVLTGLDAVVHEFTRELVRTGRVGHAVHARAAAALGEVGVVDLVGVVGYYTLVAFTLNAAEVAAPAGAPVLP
jgi:4-carboxymuconolactone decarboxylase